MAEKNTDLELMVRLMEEFFRLQEYMMITEKDSEAYKLMKVRYVQLKVILEYIGVDPAKLNLAELLKE